MGLKAEQLTAQDNALAGRVQDNQCKDYFGAGDQPQRRGDADRMAR